ncbi:MAG: CusA/CzcA family heavy metal efflux RND transporter [Deltaproteobacteria bacterium]|nr:CusA/CzcA family heavy metal efflux RND transporter [Deltaproteobacteria bacterium]
MEKLVRLSIARPWAVLALTMVFAVIAIAQLAEVPIEAFPDVTNSQVQVITLSPGRAAEEVERQVTIPIERELAGLPESSEQRSVSVYGLSVITVTFEDGADEFAARLRVGERLRQVELPTGLVARLGPESSPVGEIFRYTVEGPRVDAVERRALQDWIVGPALRRVTGVADIVSMGGFQRQFSVELDPNRLAARGLGVPDVVTALSRSNGAVGGHYLRHGAEEYVVRGVGYLRDGHDVARTSIGGREGPPITMRDLGNVLAGSAPRRGVIGRGTQDELPHGIVLLRRHSHPARVLDGVHAAIDQLNRDLAPRGARIVPYYDRTELITRALATVKHNMAEGALLVVLVLMVFLKSVRGPLIVAAVIPLALLTAFLGLRLRGMAANLISLGAIDFGILVDGAVIFIETAYHVGHEHPEYSRASVVSEAGRQVVRPVVFSLAIIAAALLPVFTMQRVEGRIFAPMAMTYAFALLGALVWTLTAVPAMAALVLPRAKDHASNANHGSEPKFITVLRRGYEHVARFAIRRARWVVLAVLGISAMGGFAGSKLGSEFLPELNEGGMFITVIFPASQSLEEGARLVPRMRRMVTEFSEVREAVSQLGRPEDGTDPAPVNVAQIMVSLHPEEQWTTGRSRAQLLDALRARLSSLPGIELVFSQPIVDNVLESISGIKGKVVLKLYGEDLDLLVRTAEAAERAIAPVVGVKDLGLYQTGTVPQLLIEIDRDAVALHGLNVADVEDVIESALGGVTATSVWQGERKVDVVVRFAEAWRGSVDRIREIPVRTPTGRAVTLGVLATVRVGWGRAAIQRAQGRRFVALKFNVEGRDLGSVVAEAQARVAQARAIPAGMTAVWGGEFENQQRSMRRLAVIVPVAIAVIGLLLFWALGRVRGAMMVLATIPACLPGAILALSLAKVNLSVSAAVGFIALLGQTVLSGLVMVSSIDELRASDPTLSLDRAVVDGVSRRLRAVLITALLASLGLLPASISHAIGSETQRPFALVVVGGVLVATPLVLLLLPALYKLIERKSPDDTPAGASLSPPAFLLLFCASIAALGGLLAPRSAHAWTLDQAVAIMRTQHRALRAQHTSTRAARQDVIAAGRWTNPQLQFQYARSLTWTSYDPILGTGQLAISQWIETAGVPAARARVAEAMVIASDAEFALLDRSLVRAIRFAYARSLEASARRDALIAGIALYDRVMRIVTARVNAGTSAPYDAQRVQLAWADQHAALSVAEGDLTEAQSAVLVALGVDGDVLVGDAEGSIRQPVPLPSLAEAERTALERPEIVALRARAQAERAQVEVERRSVFGGIGVQAGVMFGQGFEPAVNQRQVDVMVGVSVPLPILDRGQGAIAGSELRALSALERVQAAQSEARQSVRAAYRAVERRRQAQESHAQRLGSFDDQLLRAADIAYTGGRSNAYELLDAYERFVSAKLRELELLAQLRQAEWEALFLSGR